MAEPQRNAKNAATIQRKANVRAVAAQGGANAATAQKIATEEAATAGQGALEQQQQQVGTAVGVEERKTEDIKQTQDKHLTDKRKSLSTTRDELKQELGALSRDVNKQIKATDREFSLSEARREWTNSDSMRHAAAAESKTQAEWEATQKEMSNGYDDMIKKLNDETNKKIKKLVQDHKAAESKKDRESTMRIRKKIEALEREKARRKKNSAMNKKYLGAAKTTAGVAVAIWSPEPTSKAAGASMAADGVSDMTGEA